MSNILIHKISKDNHCGFSKYRYVRCVNLVRAMGLLWVTMEQYKHEGVDDNNDTMQTM